MEKTLNIGIAGCGIGGLALGAMMAARGHRVRIFDQFEAPTSIGSGLMIQPVGLRVLHTFGVVEGVLAKGAKISQMYGIDGAADKPALNVSYGTRFGLAIHRASLFDALLNNALEKGVEVKPSTSIIGVDGAQFRTKTGMVGPFDLMVDASGAGSLLSPIQTKPIKYGALWGCVDWPEDTELPMSQLTQHYQGAAKMAGVLPIGTLPGETKQKAAIFWSIRVADYPDWAAGLLTDWKNDAVKFWPAFAPFVRQIRAHSDMTMARYRHGTLGQKIGENLAYIGDAAHCASPQLGQGANMALLDAYALADALERFPASIALNHYDRSRRRHVATYQLMSRLLTPFYQSDSKTLPWLRNNILAPLGTVKPMSGLLTKVGAGDIIAPIRGIEL